eukprot:scaffold31080_cov45-Attheya_sp.AAC.2
MKSVRDHILLFAIVSSAIPSFAWAQDFFFVVSEVGDNQWCIGLDPAEKVVRLERCNFDQKPFDQLWSPAFGQITSLLFSSECLSISHNKNLNQHAPVVFDFCCEDEPLQTFTFGHNGYISVKDTEFSLTFQGSIAKSNDRIVTGKSQNMPRYKWKLVSYNGNEEFPLITWKPYENRMETNFNAKLIVSQVGNNRWCIGFDTNNGLRLEKCDFGSNFHDYEPLLWSHSHNKEIQSYIYFEKCVSVIGEKINQNVKLNTFPCDTRNRLQNFTFDENGYIRVVDTDLSITFQSSKPKIGDSIILRQSQNRDRFKWKLEDIDYGPEKLVMLNKDDGFSLGRKDDTLRLKSSTILDIFSRKALGAP